VHHSDRGSPDPRLVNAAVAGYVLLEICVIVYIAIYIARGY